MPTKKQIQLGDTVPLKLTVAERKLVLEDLMCLDESYEQIIQGTPAGDSVLMTLDDLDDFGGYIAAESNHCEDKKKQKKLDALLAKIQVVLYRYAEEEPPKPDKNKGKTTSKPNAKAATAILFQFKITLLESKPPIWRRIQVQDCTLDKLHEHIQTAMGWTNSHLHHFEIEGQRFGDPDLLEHGFEDFECLDSTTTMLSDIVPKTDKRFAFKYEYDFGDGWLHEVLFEGCPPVEKGKKYPICVKGKDRRMNNCRDSRGSLRDPTLVRGANHDYYFCADPKRACPPEDVGGVWGYQDFLTAMADPNREEHENFLEWCGGSFSPGEFDPKKATEEMKQGLPDWRRMR